MARLVDSAGGSIGPDILAPALGYSGSNNGAYLSRVASARLFGVVSGRGARLELTERGRRILAGSEPEASRARREAFFAVPLFAAVSDDVASRGGLLPDDIPGWLVDGFGETRSKARAVSDQMIASAVQAGLLRATPKGTWQFTRDPVDFTAVDNAASQRRSNPVSFRRGARSPGMGEVAVADGGLWLDEAPDGHSARTPWWRRWAVVGAAAVVLMVVAVPVALVTTGSSPGRTAVGPHVRQPRLAPGPAEHVVLSALSATTDTGSFDFAYTIRSTPASATAPTTTPSTVCQEEQVAVPNGAAAGSSTTGSGTPTPSVATATGAAPLTQGTVSGTASGVGGTLPPGFTWKTEQLCAGPTSQPDPVVQGSGVINTNPLAMVASADIGGGLDVTVRVDDASVYEEGTNDTGLAPQASDSAGSGTDLPQFAGITEGTLGTREGAVAMMGMASPTGYLDLIAPAINAASPIGTGIVDGVPVTNYQVADDLSQLAGAAGTSAAESQTISTALGVLDTEGYTSNDVVVSIDGSGFIRQVRSTDAFTDGGTVTLQATFSDFGCAGTILMPGQTGSGVPPADCTPPSGTSATSTTSTTAGPAADTAPTSGSSTTTSSQPGPASTTSLPSAAPSTTTTTSAGTTTPAPTKPSGSTP